jgi:hypothetical protein
VAEMIRVIVPYRTLNHWTERVLDSYGLPVMYAPLGDDDDAYRRLLQRLWQARQTVVIVEHDVVPWYGAIEELHHCMGLWCSCSYRLQGGYGVTHSLGCTKISARLMQLTDGIWDEPRKWDVLDQHLFFAARAVGQEPHGHRPPVLHLSDKEYAVREGR